MGESCQVLPDDMIEDILARLPAKPVLRCRCLSQAWAATLSSDHFADRHLRLANGHGGPRILLLHDWGFHGRKAHMWSPDHPGGTKLMNIPRNLTLDRFPYKPTRPRINPGYRVPRLVTQQRRGLVVLDATAAGIQYVYNPSTGQMTALPDGRPTGCSSSKESKKERYASLGLGYEEQSRRHKVVRISYRGRDAEKLPVSPRCEVYVVSSTGFWRPAKSEKPPAGWVNRDGTSVFAQGHVYWLAQPRLNSPSQETFIVSFSLLSETFGIVPPPPPLDMGSEVSLVEHHLTVLDGLLCLFCNMRPWYHLYLLREAGVWDLHCRIDASPPEVRKLLPYMVRLHPIAAIDDGRRILLIQPRYPWCCAISFRLCAYAPMTGHTENLLDSSKLFANRTMALSHAALYEESIVSTGKRHEDIIFAMSLMLLRLPDWTLRKLRCICKSWRAMIQSDRFAEKRRLMCPSDFIY